WSWRSQLTIWFQLVRTWVTSLTASPGRRCDRRRGVPARGADPLALYDARRLPRLPGYRGRRRPLRPIALRAAECRLAVRLRVERCAGRVPFRCGVLHAGG